MFRCRAARAKLGRRGVPGVTVESLSQFESQYGRVISLSVFKTATIHFSLAEYTKSNMKQETIAHGEGDGNSAKNARKTFTHSTATHGRGTTP